MLPVIFPAVLSRQLVLKHLQNLWKKNFPIMQEKCIGTGGLINMETNRLIIRKFTDDDFQDFSDLICDKMKSKYSVYDEQFPTDNESIKGMFCRTVGKYSLIQS